MVKIGQDLNELNAEIALTNIVLNMPGHVYWKDISGVYLGCNDKQAQSLGFKKGTDIVGKTDYDLPWGEGIADKFRENDSRIANAGITEITEEPSVMDGKKVTVLSQKAPLKDKNGKVYGVLGISINITELKKAQQTAENALESLKKSQVEEQKQRKEAERLNIENTKHIAELKIAKITTEKEQEMRKTVMVLVGDIVHDLRTPIAIIEDGADILGSVSSGLKKILKEASDLKSETLNSLNSGKLNYVINDMSIAQKDSVRMINDFIDTTLRELSVAQKNQDGAIAHEELTKCSSRRILENALDSYPRRNNIKINECFPYDFFLMGNSILMMKVLFNLIRNAEEQIIANGKGEITLTTKKAEDKNLLIVKDTAGGAPPEVVDNLFKEFFTTKKDGSGIGLAFCKKMMENFGGDLTCNSVLGESMEFILSFPKIAITK